MNGLKQWDGIKHFHPDDNTDNWGDPHKINRALLLELDRLRSFLGVPVYVTSGYREARKDHEGASEHHYGNAADIVVPQFKGSLLDLFFAASRFKFNGIGIYRDWEWKGVKYGGLHVDVRDAAYRAQWFCFKNPIGNQEYIGLSLETLKGYGLL